MDGSMRTRGLVILLGILLSGFLFGFKSAKEDTSKSGTVIGIELGITCSCVGAYKDGQMPENFVLTGIPPAPRRTPQIEVTSEVDANGILNVKAEDKVAGKLEKITIINEKGQLAQDEIDRMVQEAEQFAEEDKKVKEKIDVCDRLETYIQNMKETIYDKDKLAKKLHSDMKVRVEEDILGMIEWLVDNQSAPNEDYDEMLKELEAVWINSRWLRFKHDDDFNDELYTLCSWLRI